MSDNKLVTNNKALLPDLPRDVVVPVYRYQRDERAVNRDRVPAQDGSIASLLASLEVRGCAAADQL